MLKILAVVPTKADALPAAFASALAVKAEVRAIRSAEEVDALMQDPAARPTLVLWPASISGMPLRDAAIAVMMVDARVHQCAVSEQEADAFHEDTEGLGFLPALKVRPDAEDAEALLTKLKALGAF